MSFYYRHPGERARRRHPSKYQAVQCPEARAVSDRSSKVERAMPNAVDVQRHLQRASLCRISDPFCSWRAEKGLPPRDGLPLHSRE